MSRYNLDRRRDSYNSWCKRYALCGKILSFIFTIGIGASLYYSLLDIDRTSNSWCKRYALCGKILSFIFTIGIGASLYYFAGYDNIHPEYNLIILLAPLPPFLTIVAMVLHFLILAFVGMINVVATNNLTGKPKKEANEPPIGAWKQERQGNQPQRSPKKKKEWWEEEDDDTEYPF